MHNWESQHQPSLTPARRGFVPFAVESGGEAQTSAVGAGVGEALPVPSHRSEILVWLSMTAHRAPFHPGGPLQMSPEVQGPTGTQGCHQGCPWLPGEPPERVFPGSCLSAIELRVRSQCYAEDNWVFVGSSSSLLIPVSHSLLPGNRAVAGFPPCGCTACCDGQADPTPPALLQVVLNCSLKLKQHRQIDWDLSWRKGYLGHITWKNWFASPCREKLIYLGVQHAGHPPLPAHPRRQTGTDSILHSPSCFWSPNQYPPPPHCHLHRTQVQDTNNELLSQQLHHHLRAWPQMLSVRVNYLSVKVKHGNRIFSHPQ